MSEVEWRLQGWENARATNAGTSEELKNIYYNRRRRVYRGTLYTELVDDSVMSRPSSLQPTQNTKTRMKAICYTKRNTKEGARGSATRSDMSTNVPDGEA